MSRRLKLGARQSGDAIDFTRFVFLCPLCPWQVQAGYAARRDLGLTGVQEAIGLAHRDHILEDHSDHESDDELEWDDGTTHNLAKVSPDGTTEAALIGTMLPRWWVDR